MSWYQSTFTYALGALTASALGVAAFSETPPPVLPSPAPIVLPAVEQTQETIVTETVVTQPEPIVEMPETVTSEPTRTPEPSCNSNYSGCLKPNASDYDCAGGSGNGPYYTGPVQVLGYDQYDLDRDNDGWGCE